MQLYGVLRQAFLPIFPRDLRGQDRPGHTVDIGDFQLCIHRFALLYSRSAQMEQGIDIQGFLQLMILHHIMIAFIIVGADFRLVQKGG